MSRLLYLTNTLSGTFQALQDGGSAPNWNFNTAISGFIGSVSGWYYRLNAGSLNGIYEGETFYPNSLPIASGECLILPVAQTATCNAGVWDIAIAAYYTDGDFGGDPPTAIDTYIELALWKGSNADGSGASQLSNTTTYQIGSFSTQGPVVLNVTTPSIGPFTFSNEYLFIKVAAYVNLYQGQPPSNLVLVSDASNRSVISTPTWTSGGGGAQTIVNTNNSTFFGMGF